MLRPQTQMAAYDDDDELARAIALSLQSSDITLKDKSSASTTNVDVSVRNLFNQQFSWESWASYMYRHVLIRNTYIVWVFDNGSN